MLNSASWVFSYQILMKWVNFPLGISCDAKIWRAAHEALCKFMSCDAQRTHSAHDSHYSAALLVTTDYISDAKILNIVPLSFSFMSVSNNFVHETFTVIHATQTLTRTSSDIVVRIYVCMCLCVHACTCGTCPLHFLDLCPLSPALFTTIQFTFNMWKYVFLSCLQTHHEQTAAYSLSCCDHHQSHSWDVCWQRCCG